MKQSQIIKLFTKGEVNYEDIENQILEVSFGFKLVQVAKTRFDTRLSQTSKEWMVNKELGWGGSLSNDFPNRWDITSDATMVCYRSNFVEYVFFELIQISLDDQIEIEKKLLIEKAEKLIRNKVVDTLTKVLIHEMMPFSKLSTGYLEIEHGIHLHQIKRGMHMHMRYKPRNGSETWVANQVLCWGSNTGWDITTDGKIACCRINYDDYVNFEIQVLTQDQIEEYKMLFPNNSFDKLDKILILKSMLEEGLITQEQFDFKRLKILKLYN
jgi:hypothetical protein